MRRFTSSLFLSIALLGVLSAAAHKHSSWIDRANSDTKTARLLNPYEGQAEAVNAGEKLYQRYCVSCHGADAEGIGANPPLHSPTVKRATPGALYWLLRNGSLQRGMPSWSYLTPQQRWQLVTWMKTLDFPHEKK